MVLSAVHEPKELPIRDRRTVHPERIIGTIRFSVTSAGPGQDHDESLLRNLSLHELVGTMAAAAIDVSHDALDFKETRPRACLLVSKGMIHWVHLTVSVRIREDGGASREAMEVAVIRLFANLKQAWDSQVGGDADVQPGDGPGVDDDELAALLARLLAKLREMGVPLDLQLLEKTYGSAMLRRVVGARQP